MSGWRVDSAGLSSTCLSWSQKFFLTYHRMHEWAAREPWSGEKEKPLVTLNLNLTFIFQDQDLTLELGLVDILPTGHRKSIYYNSVDPWCRQIPVPHRLFISSPCHNFGCVLWSFWWTLIFANCETVAFQPRRRWAPFAKKLMPFYSEVPRPSYKT